MVNESFPAFLTLLGKELEHEKSRYTVEQIAFALKQAETGTPVAKVIGRMSVSEQTFYRWKNVYGGLGVGELRRVKQFVVELRLDKHILQDVIAVLRQHEWHRFWVVI